MKIKKFSEKPTDIESRVGAKPVVCYPNDKINYHHTQNDIVEKCSPKGLGEVGTLMVHHIYTQK